MHTDKHRWIDTLTWLLGDHLGSTSMVADATGVMVSEVRYSAFGENRYQNGTMTTDYLYTGQRQEAEIGLYFYVSRWYDPQLDGSQEYHDVALDGIGWRVIDVTVGGGHLSLDLNVDVIVVGDKGNWDWDILVTPGVETGIEAGVQYSTGLLLLFNYPTRKSASGLSTTLGGNITAETGVEAEITVGAPNLDGKPPIAIYGGLSVGARAGGHITAPSTTFSLRDLVINRIEDVFIP